MGVQRVVQWCFMGISRVLYGYFFYVSGVFAYYVKWMFDLFLKSVSSVQIISLDLFWVFKGALMLFLEVCFEGASRVFQHFFRVRAF